MKNNFMLILILLIVSHVFSLSNIPDEFGEKFTPSVEYGSLMGHSIFFYSHDTNKPVKFIKLTEAGAAFDPDAEATAE